MAIRSNEPTIALWEIADDVCLYLITYDRRLHILQSYRAALSLALGQKYLEHGEYQREQAECCREEARRFEKLYIVVKYDLFPPGHTLSYLAGPDFGVEYLENDEWERKQQRLMRMEIERESRRPYIGRFLLL
jgi:hypothetical protein